MDLEGTAATMGKSSVKDDEYAEDEFLEEVAVSDVFRILYRFYDLRYVIHRLEDRGGLFGGEDSEERTRRVVQFFPRAFGFGGAGESGS